MNIFIGILGLLVRIVALYKSGMLIRHSRDRRLVVLTLLLAFFVVYPLLALGFSPAAWNLLSVQHMLLFVGTSALTIVSAQFVGYYVKRYTQNSQSLQNHLDNVGRPESGLIKAEERLRLALEATELIVWEFDTTSRDISFETADSLQLSSTCRVSSIPYASFLQSVHEPDKDKVTSLVDGILNGLPLEKDRFQLEVRIMTETAHEWWRIEGKPYINRAARVDRIIGTARCIHEQKEFELRIKEQEERLRLTTEATEIGLWEWDVDTQQVTHDENIHINTLRLIFDFEDFQNRIHPSYKTKVLQALERSRQEGTLYKEEFPIRNDEGQYTWILDMGRMVQDKHRPSRRMIGATIDISERKEKDELIRFQAKLLESIGEAVIAQNTKGEIVFLNKVAKEIYGDVPDESLPFDVSDYIPPEHRIINQPEIVELLKSGKTWSGESIAYSLDRSAIPVHFTVSPYQNENGEYGGFISVTTDLTDYKEIQAALLASEERLRLRMDQLQAIYNMAEVLKDAEDLDAIYQAAADGLESVSGIDRIAILSLPRGGLPTIEYVRGLSDAYLGMLRSDCEWRCEEPIPKPLCIHDARTDRTVAHVRAVLEREDIGALAVYSLVYQNQLIGRLVVHWDSPVEPESINNDLLVNIADQIAVAIAKKKAELALKNRTVELQTITDHIPDQIIRVNRNFRILFDNKSPSMQNLKSQAQSRSLEHVFPTREAVSLWRRQVSQVFARGAKEEFEYDVESATGAGAPIQNRYYHAVIVPESPFSNADEYPPDQIDSAVAIIRDTTEQRLLQKAIIDMSTRQQRRIGQDLHDELGQLLTAIGFLLAGLSQDLKKHCSTQVELVYEINELVEKAIAQTRILAEGLNPVTLEIHGLRTSLERLTLHTEKLYGVLCTFQANSEFETLPDDMASQIYRIAQEAVNNSVKHSQATYIEVKLMAYADNGKLTIRDNGMGFMSEQHPTEGQGLQIMRYRAQILGGTLDIQSAPDKGTLITCDFEYVPEIVTAD